MAPLFFPTAMATSATAGTVSRTMFLSHAFCQTPYRPANDESNGNSSNPQTHNLPPEKHLLAVVIPAVVVPIIS